MNPRIYILAEGPENFKNFLAEPDKQWKTGYSAKTLAYSWCEAAGFPSEISNAFKDSNHPVFELVEPLLIIPEHKVDLAGGRRPSQNDVFVLAKSAAGLISIAVEGKVSEPFGDVVENWLGNNPSDGKTTRLQFLIETLGIEDAPIHDIRYQLLHRTASALLEADKFNASHALMLVHSFSQEDEHISDYRKFLTLFGLEAVLNAVVGPVKRSGKNLYFCWVRGNKKYLLR